MTPSDDKSSESLNVLLDSLTPTQWASYYAHQARVNIESESINQLGRVRPRSEPESMQYVALSQAQSMISIAATLTKILEILQSQHDNR